MDTVPDNAEPQEEMHGLMYHFGTEDGHPERKIKCKYCEKTFKRSFHARRHELIHSDKIPFQCQYCLRPFYRRENWKHHEKICTKAKALINNGKCGTDSNSESIPNVGDGQKETQLGTNLQLNAETINRFISNMANSDAIPIRCPDSNYKNYQIAWESMNNIERPYKCQSCPLAFRHMGNLQRHAVIHSDIKEFICDICGADFFRNDQLKTHKKKSHGIEIVKRSKQDSDDFLTCQVCNKKYASVRNLKRHHLVHIGDKPFKCNQCPASFARNDNLQRHIRNCVPNSQSTALDETPIIPKVELQTSDDDDDEEDSTSQSSFSTNDKPSFSNSENGNTSLDSIVKVEPENFNN